MGPTRSSLSLASSPRGTNSGPLSEPRSLPACRTQETTTLIAPTASASEIATHSPIPVGEGATAVAAITPAHTRSAPHPRQVGANDRRRGTRGTSASTELGDLTIAFQARSVDSAEGMSGDDRHDVERLLDDIERVGSVECRLWPKHKSVGQGGTGDGLNILGRDVVSSSPDR